MVCLNSITVCLCPVGRNARCKERDVPISVTNSGRMGTSFERKDFWDRLGGRYVVDQAASGHDEWIFCQVIYFFVFL